MYKIQIVHVPNDPAIEEGVIFSRRFNSAEDLVGPFGKAVYERGEIEQAILDYEEVLKANV